MHVLVEQLKTMKIINKKLKIFYSLLGSWKSFHTELISDDQSRQQFNEKITRYLTTNKIDGFGKFSQFALWMNEHSFRFSDIDWDLPADQFVRQDLLSKWLTVRTKRDLDDQ